MIALYKFRLTNTYIREINMPTFAGFTTKRYQEHDTLIKTLVNEFNKNKQTFVGGTASQISKIPNLSEALIKSWIIQETGGNDARSLAAWKVDPAQVNVPGDWSSYKQSIGLSAPTKRNEGTVKQNLKAAIQWLARKGFGKSGQPPSNRSSATFDGWEQAFTRYNGRSVKTTNGKAYSVNYAKRIIERANNPTTHNRIELPKP